jgi:excisionase family DNA binding protein|tara:strand:+ start:195 stop:383 length:189 start_codon:yes stop_codon:yes gene_type:complete
MDKSTEKARERQFYSPLEVADRLGCSVSLVRTQISKGVIPIKRLGNRVFISANWVHAYEGDE